MADTTDTFEDPEPGTCDHSDGSWCIYEITDDDMRNPEVIAAIEAEED